MAAGDAGTAADAGTAVAAAGAGSARPTAAAPPAYRWRLPAWAPEPLVPDDNPMSEAKVALGRALFYDKGLSANRTQSCAGCHEQARGFSDGRKLALGSTGMVGLRNAMPLANVAYLPTLTWANPNLTTLEQQALVPLFGDHPVEMGMAGREDVLLARLKAKPSYRRQFARAFPERGGDISLWSVTRAIAAFERSLLSMNSPYDRYRYEGKSAAISASAKRGETLFFGDRLECYHCHGGLHFTDNQIHRRLPEAETGYHNTGLYNVDGKGAYPPGQQGLREFSGEPQDEGRFRTPSLRNVALTAPYMHDGSVATLDQAIRRHYAVKGRAALGTVGPNPLRSQFIEGFELSEREVGDLKAFLAALSDADFLRTERHADPAGARRKTDSSNQKGR
ncbi:MbnH family di-heme enzyme [Rugamonas sp. CCM 8940]|nr:methanobactin export MATE transporter MbnM [Rugamonas sp. CCM 8940]